MKKKAFRTIIPSIAVISFFGLSHCAGTPLEILYEPGITTPLITLSYENQEKVVVTRSYAASIEIRYKVNRPIEDFINHLQPRGKIECSINIANTLGSGQLASHDYPLWGSALSFVVDELDEAGTVEPILCHSKEDFNSPVEGTVRYYINAIYIDQNGKKHRGRISNDLVIPARFYDRD